MSRCTQPPFAQEGRALAGSICFLLDAGEQSQPHQIDCEELWYYHEGFRLVPDSEIRERMEGKTPAGT